MYNSKFKYRQVMNKYKVTVDTDSFIVEGEFFGIENNGSLKFYNPMNESISAFRWWNTVEKIEE
jgi:hypothetical protein